VVSDRTRNPWAAVDVIVIRLRRDDFVDIKQVPYPVKGLANGF
jgi:hypothetical protein